MDNIKKDIEIKPVKRNAQCRKCNARNYSEDIPHVITGDYESPRPMYTLRIFDHEVFMCKSCMRRMAIEFGSDVFNLE